MLRITVSLVLTFFLVDLSQCLFYTDSKENEHPRIGKRKEIDDSEDNDIWQDNVRRERWELSFSEKNSFIIKEYIKDNLSLIHPSLIFKLFDINEDKVLSPREFTMAWQRMLEWVGANTKSKK